jgi:hypothetical protein
MTAWNDYTDTARQLAALRRDHAAANTRHQMAAQAGQADIDRIGRHLDTQRAQLTDLARMLRLPEPNLHAAGRSAVSNVPQAVQHAAAAANTADTEARRAEQAAGQPALLPGMTPTGRNALIYTTWALIGWLAQCGLMTFVAHTDFGVAAWSLCGLPALAWFAGYLTITIAGQPRIVGGEYPKSLKLGGVICFIGMPLAWLLLIAAFSLLRT